MTGGIFGIASLLWNYSGQGKISEMITPKTAYSFPIDIHKSVTLGCADISTMSRNQKLTLADLLGEGVMTDEMKIHGDDGPWREYSDDMVDLRVNLPYEIRIREDTGEIEMKYSDHNGYSIFNSASLFSESGIDFAKTYLSNGLAEKQGIEIILRGDNLQYLKDGGSIVNPIYYGYIPDKEKLGIILKEGIFSNEDPRYEKIGNIFAYSILEGIKNKEENGFKNLKIIINPNQNELLEYNYSVMLEKEDQSYRTLVHFPKGEDANAIRSFGSNQLEKRLNPLYLGIGACANCHFYNTNPHVPDHDH